VIRAFQNEGPNIKEKKMKNVLMTFWETKPIFKNVKYKIDRARKGFCLFFFQIRIKLVND
jgi:hypothetical protein